MSLEQNPQKVFLGGSCNPTTWRQDIAIPFLKHHDITFYNPQVSEWRPELIALEEKAKQSAEVLFFVIDNATRSTASMVEAAYLAGCGRQLILIMNDVEEPVVISGETLRESEMKDLERSHAFLADFMQRQGIPVFSDIKAALQTTDTCMKQHIKVTDLANGNDSHRTTSMETVVSDPFLKVKDAFYKMDAENKGKLSYKEFCLAYRAVTNDEIPPKTFRSTSGLFGFEEFCQLIEDYKYRRKGLFGKMVFAIMHLPHRTLDLMMGNLTHHNSKIEAKHRDVFLGGTCGTSTWRQEIAIPMLKDSGISFYNPQLDENDWSPRYIPLEATVKDSCRMLLFAITDYTRGVGSMLEAAHYIGQGCNMVLCLQKLPPDGIVGNEQLTETSIKDYNRARSYLSDVAQRAGIRVFDDVTKTLDYAISVLRRKRTLSGCCDATTQD